MKTKKERPLGIKILSGLYFLGSIFMLLIGIIALISSYFIVNNPTEVESAFTAEELAQIGSITSLSPFFLMFGIFCIGLAILDIFLGFGFWKGQSWARITTLILSGIGIVYGVTGIVSNFSDIFSIGVNIVTIAIDGLIIWYLMRKNVIVYFAKKKD